MKPLTPLHGSTLARFRVSTTAKIKAVIIGAIAMAGVAGHWAVQHQAQVRLGKENNWLEAEVDRLSRVAAQAQTSLSLSTTPPTDLLGLRSKVESLRRQTNELASLREQNHALAKLLNWTKPGEFVPAEQWIDAGALTPTDAFLTFHWASKNLRNDRLEQVADVPTYREEVSRIARAAGIDSEGRHTFSHVWFREDVCGLQVQSQWQHSPDEVELEVTYTLSDGTIDVQRHKLRRVGENWKLDLRGIVWLNSWWVESAVSAVPQADQ